MSKGAGPELRGSLDLYRLAFLDWHACAAAGRHERAPSAIAAISGATVVDRVTVAAAAGHILDFDDTFRTALRT